MHPRYAKLVETIIHRVIIIDNKTHTLKIYAIMKLKNHETLTFSWAICPLSIKNGLSMVFRNTKYFNIIVENLNFGDHQH